MNIKNVTSRESRVSSPAAAQAQLALRSPLSAFRSPRSGILLLVVLSMLTLFLLIGTAFIVSANQYRKANKILAKVTESSNSSVDQVNLLEEVLNQLVRDTNNQNSSLRFHSLLRDMYGNDGLLAEIDVVEWATAFEWDTIQPGDNTNGHTRTIATVSLEPYDHYRPVWYFLDDPEREQQRLQRSRTHVPRWPRSWAIRANCWSQPHCVWHCL